MTAMTSDMSYQDLTDALAEADISTAEAHGILCGILCATAGRHTIPWENLIFTAQPDPDCVTLFKKLYAISYQQLDAYSFEFTLLLPEDETNINVRAEALGLWCQGFLIGLQQNPDLAQSSASSEITEAIHDITEIAQVDHGTLKATEEDETAYFNLVEYVRLAVLLLFQEFKDHAAPNAVDPPSLH